MLATLWFCLAAFTLTGFVLLDGFDLGAGIVQLFLAKTENDRTQILRSIPSGLYGMGMRFGF
jgi:cytochrome bd ubiquinol oxidase subunit II